MAKIRLHLDCRRPLKNSAGFPLKIMVSHRSVSASISLDITLEKEQWNASDELVTKQHPQYRQLNNWLSEQLEKCNNLLLLLRMRPDYVKLTTTEIKRIINKEVFEVDSTPTLPRFKPVLEEFIKYKKDGTRSVYLQTLSRLKDYCGDIEALTFEQINYDWLMGFNEFMSRTSSSQNYRNIHLRNIRAVFNYAIDIELISKYPFRRFKLKYTKTPKRSLSIQQLRELFNYPVEEYARQYVDMFKLMFLLCGINSVDLFHLKEIKNGRIEYYRAKTGKFYTIKVEPEAEEIINRYRGKKYLLNVLDTYNNYKDYIHRMNKALQRIGTMDRKGRGGRKIITPSFPGLSSYWARHSWATAAGKLDIPDAVITHGLGHAGENSTSDIYINRDVEKVDIANRKIIDCVFYGKED